MHRRPLGPASLFALSVIVSTAVVGAGCSSKDADQSNVAPATEAVSSVQTPTDPAAAADSPARYDNDANRDASDKELSNEEPVEEEELDGVEGRRERKAGSRSKDGGNKIRQPGRDQSPGKARPTTPLDLSSADAKSDPLLAELGELETRMRSAGLRPPSDPAFAGETQAEQAKTALAKTSCEDLCGLREAICGLETRICSLASGRDDARYINACARAQGDCSVATQACSACSE